MRRLTLIALTPALMALLIVGCTPDRHMRSPAVDREEAAARLALAECKLAANRLVKGQRTERTPAAPAIAMQEARKRRQYIRDCMVVKGLPPPRR